MRPQKFDRENATMSKSPRTSIWTPLGYVVPRAFSADDEKMRDRRELRDLKLGVEVQRSRGGRTRFDGERNRIIPRTWIRAIEFGNFDSSARIVR